MGEGCQVCHVHQEVDAVLLVFGRGGEGDDFYVSQWRERTYFFLGGGSDDNTIDGMIFRNRIFASWQLWLLYTYRVVFELSLLTSDFVLPARQHCWIAVHNSAT